MEMLKLSTYDGNGDDVIGNQIGNPFTSSCYSEDIIKNINFELPISAKVKVITLKYLYYNDATGETIRGNKITIRINIPS